MRRWGGSRLVVVSIGVVVAQLGGLAINAFAAQSAKWNYGLSLIQTHPFYSACLLTAAMIVTALGSPGRKDATRDFPRPPAAPDVPGWIVRRTEELDQIVDVLRRSAGTIGITTGLAGAGGFGKTVMATLVQADHRVVRRFRRRIYAVTLGRDVRNPAAIAAKVNDLAGLITGERPDFADPKIAGTHLGRVLDTMPRTLLVIDDVWSEDQLGPFVTGGRRCSRLITTRSPGVLPNGSTTVVVDRMSEDQARRLLCWDLPDLQPGATESLLEVTGRWPLLLRLVNRVLVDQKNAAIPLAEAASAILFRLRDRGSQAVDAFRPEPDILDASDPEQRRRAVKATVEAATQLLPGAGADRLIELGIFAEDELVPVELVAALWNRTSGMDGPTAKTLLRRMHELWLVSWSERGASVISLHDVLRSYLRGVAAPDQLRRTNEALLEAVGSSLPVATVSGYREPAWWKLDSTHRYLWDHLIGHLWEAGVTDRAERVAGDLRWITARLAEYGPAGAIADLGAVDTTLSRLKMRELKRIAHLLGATRSAPTALATVSGLIGHVDAWRTQLQEVCDDLRTPLIANLWTTPDLGDSALRQVLTGHSAAITAIMISDDGSQLATGDASGMVRVWESATGVVRRVLRGHSSAIASVAFSVNGQLVLPVGGQ